MIQTHRLQTRFGTGIRPRHRRCYRKVLAFAATFIVVMMCIGTSIAKAQTAYDRALGIPDSGLVVSVIFEGNHVFSTSVLQSVVNTRVPSWFERAGHTITLGALGSARIYTDQPTRDRDSISLEEFYRENGYLFARASVEVRTDLDQLHQVELIDRQNRLLPRTQRKTLPTLPDTIIFHIVEGPVSKVVGIAYSGLEDLPTELQPELTEHSLMKLNADYSSETVKKETQRLQSILSENGYPFFRYDSVAVEAASEHTVNVHVLFYFRTDHRYRFGNVRIVYDTSAPEQRRVSETAIRSQLDVVPGQWYKASVIQSSQTNLYRLNNFEIARISFDTAQIAAIPEAQRDGSAIDQILFLRLRVSQELLPGFFIGEGLFGQTGVFTFSAGLSLTYTNHNTFGGAQDLNFQSSYQLFPKNETNYSANVDLTFPYRRLPLLADLIPVITNSPLTVGVGFSQASQEGRSEERLYHVHTGINATIGDPQNRTNIVPDLLIEYAYRQYQDSTLRALYNSIIRKQLNTIISINGQWDRTNDLFNPTDGFYTGGTIELGTPALKFLAPSDFGSAAYLKGIVHLKDFLELQDNGRLILGGRLRVGYIDLFYPGSPVPPQTDVPFERRFYAGGGSSVRGWPSSALLVAPHSDANRETSEGGYKSLEFNLELRWAPFHYDNEITSSQKLLSPLRVAVFYDAGQVWDYGVTMNPNQIAMAVGTGIRYLTIFGAFRFDVGFKLYDPNPVWGTSTPPVDPVSGKNQQPAYPDTKGEWLFQRKFSWDVLQFQFNLGEAF